MARRHLGLTATRAVSDVVDEAALRTVQAYRPEAAAAAACFDVNVNEFQLIKYIMILLQITN